MDYEKLVEQLAQLNMDSNARIGRVNEMVTELVKATTSLHDLVANEQKRTDHLIEVFDRHTKELESNRDSLQRHCQQLYDHQATLLGMMERCQKMQAKCLDTINNLTQHSTTGGITIGDNNTI